MGDYHVVFPLKTFELSVSSFQAFGTDLTNLFEGHNAQSKVKI